MTLNYSQEKYKESPQMTYILCLFKCLGELSIFYKNFSLSTIDMG